MNFIWGYIRLFQGYFGVISGYFGLFWVILGYFGVLSYRVWLVCKLATRPPCG